MRVKHKKKYLLLKRLFRNQLYENNNSNSIVFYFILGSLRKAAYDDSVTDAKSSILFFIDLSLKRIYYY